MHPRSSAGCYAIQHHHWSQIHLVRSNDACDPTLMRQYQLNGSNTVKRARVRRRKDERSKSWHPDIMKLVRAIALSDACIEKLNQLSPHAEVRFLRSCALFHSLGLRDREIGRAIAWFPQSINRSVDVVKQKVTALSVSMNLTADETKKIVCGYPVVINKSLEEIEGLKDRFASIGLHGEEAKSALCRFPPLSGLKVTDRVTRLKNLLIGEYKVPQSVFLKMIAKHTRMLGHSQQNIEVKLEYFESLGFSKEEVGRLFVRGPSLFGFNVETGYKTRVAWFKSIGVDDEGLRKITRSEPLALIYSLEKLNKGYQLLREFGLTRDEILDLYMSRPRLLGCNLDSPLQKAKAAFFKSVLNMSMRDVLVTYPLAIQSSLIKKLMVRYEYLLSKRSNRAIILADLVVTDEAFCKKYGETIPRYRQFCSEWYTTRGKALEDEMGQRKSQ